MSARKPCREAGCGFDMPLSMQHCPHCGRPRLFPNVDAASMPEEKAELDRRYGDAINDSVARGVEKQVAAFEKAVTSSKAVLCTSFQEVLRISKSDNELAKTFYARGVSNLEKGSHVLQGKGWDAIRTSAETALFGDENKREIHFAAMSLDEVGLSEYGECSITLRTELISHRISTFEANMLVFFKKRGADFWAEDRLPPGFRSTWEERAKHAVAKLASRITKIVTDGDFPRVLLTPGKTSAEDEFIELHVFGQITRRSFEKVVLTKRATHASHEILAAAKFNIEQIGAIWEDRSTMR